MDAKTRYLLVSRVTEGRSVHDAAAVFTEARGKARKNPAEVVTDGLPAYADAFESSFAAGRKAPMPTHTREIHLSKPTRSPNNNRVERMNATLRERQKVTRGLKKPTGPLTRGHAAYYNLLRPHQALGGKTPAEAAGLVIKSGAGSRLMGTLVLASRRQP
jgi:transposase-like protein